ncbi:MAG: DUF4129 domain-containing protein, partial [Flavobacteriales bacterium]
CIIGIIAILIYYFLRSQGISLFKKEKEIPGQYLPPEMNVAETTEEDIDKEIEIAEKNKDYHSATRYSFIKVLRSLHHNEMIEWEENKTNLEYYREIPREELKSLFLEVSDIFDAIWYGDYKMDEELYRSSLKPFENLINKLDQLEKATYAKE